MHAEYIDRTASTMTDAPQRRACQHYHLEEDLKVYDCSCHVFKAEVMEKIQEKPVIPNDFDDSMETVDTKELAQLRCIDQVARQVFTQLEESVKYTTENNTPAGLDEELWESFGRALFDGRKPEGLTPKQELRFWQELTMLLPHNFTECNSPPWSQIEDYIKHLTLKNEAAPHSLPNVKRPDGLMPEYCTDCLYMRYPYYVDPCNRCHAGSARKKQGSSESAPHEVRTPSTHEEVMASDNKVIKDAYVKSLADSKPTPGSPYDSHHAKPTREADAVYGCRRCGKPIALVGDLIPLDELCPWCRESDSPRVHSQRINELIPKYVPPKVKPPPTSNGLREEEPMLSEDEQREVIASAPGQIAPSPQKCCGLDTDGDGNCPIHSAPGVEREVPEPWPQKPEHRCPHDGGACTHNCDSGECFREFYGMSLSTPHEGYPLPGHGLGYKGSCEACNIEAAIGTEEVPHPIDRRLHTCVLAEPHEVRPHKYGVEDSPQELEHKLIQKALNWMHFNRNIKYQRGYVHEEHKRVTEELHQAAKEYEAERKKQESNPSGWKCNHEPDTALEARFWQGIEGIMQITVEGQCLRIRVCKHCICLYAEEK